jgi:hypothetical protein
MNLQPHQLRRRALQTDELFVERYRIIAKEPCTDELNASVRRLIRLLESAWAYGGGFFPQRTPVILHAKATNETGERWALVDHSPELALPNPLFDTAVEAQALIESGMTLARFSWRANEPGVLPSAVLFDDRFTEDEDVANAHFLVNHEQTNAALTHIYCFDDSLAAFSTNFVATASFSLFSVSGSTPAVNDIVYFGADEPFFAIAGQITVAGVYSWTETWEYWNGANWNTVLTAGTDYTLFPDSTPFKQVGRWAFAWKAKSDWAKTTINAQNKFWVRVRISAFTSHTTTPQNGTKTVFTVRSGEVRIPAASVKGDGPPYALAEFRPGAGGGTTPAMGLTSAVFAGVRSRDLTDFNAFLNLGDALPTGWAVAAGTDATITADPTAPGGDRMNVTFGTDSTMVARATLTGTNKLHTYRGQYRVFLRAQQIGGGNGETRVSLRVYIHSNAAGSPQLTKPVVALAAHDLGIELIDLTPGGYLQLPFAGYQDLYDLMSSGEVLFEVRAERTTGAATLRLYDIILLPADESILQYDDPISDATTGASALRGGTKLEDDNGLVMDRTIKRIWSGSQWVIAETWSRKSDQLKLRQGVENRIYFVAAHYIGATFGLVPFFSEPGMLLQMALYLHPQYLWMRGDD